MKLATAMEGATLLMRKHKLVAVMESTTRVNKKIRNFSTLL